MFKKIAKDDILSLIELYRVVSIFLTVSIYMLRGLFEQYNVLVMFFIIICVIISAFLLLYLYRKSCHIKARLYLLLFVEVVGISFLMMFTGGLKSPFIWCFLNPLLIISYYINSPQKIVCLSLTVVLLCSIGYFVERGLGLREYLLFNSNVILSYILILILVNILSEYSKK